MADIDVKCPDCQTITTLSEFADVRSIQCKSCKRTIELQPTGRAPAATKGLRLNRPEPEPDSNEQAPPPEGYLASIKPPQRKRRSSRWRPGQHITAWALFIVLGTLMWFLRYGQLLESSQRDLLTQFAPLVVLAFHVLILLKAFQDAVFQGILCLLIPGYSFIYLFFITDDFYARATFAALLVGMGEDSFYYYQDMVRGVYEAVTAWLASGG